MSTEAASTNNQRPGGYPIDYSRRRWHRNPRNTPELTEYIEQWIAKRRGAIWEVRERGDHIDQGGLDQLSFHMVTRWSVAQCGNSSFAWMERASLFSAMLLDYRSRRFGRRALDEDLRYDFELYGTIPVESELNPEYHKFSDKENNQVSMAYAFASEWQRYLGTLLIRPPGDPPPDNYAFPTMYSAPDTEVKRFVAQLAHCRPAGAFFDVCRDQWILAGGRETCRKPLFCPNCHARQAGRLVERVQQGPWLPSRQRNRRLVLVRLAISTDQLNLSRVVQARERDQLGFYDWLRTSLDDYYASPGDEEMFQRIDCNQEMSHTLTPIEVNSAAGVLKQLVQLCKCHGLEGGLSFHNIGPAGRNYLHELCIVGEVKESNLSQFAAAFGVNAEPPELNGVAIESIIFASEYSNAARLAIAGSSWKFNLDSVGASLNSLAQRRCYSENWGPLGLRGALAWQPVFLFSSISFWSRYRVLKATRFKTYRAFGTWSKLLKPDRDHQTEFQRRRHMRSKDDRLSGGTNNRSIRLQRIVAQSKISRKELAARAGVSPAALSRFVRHRYGSTELMTKIAQALREMDLFNSCAMPAPNLRFPNASSVKMWLETIGRNQRWLALHLDCSPSKISRLLAQKSRWSVEFARYVEEFAKRREAEELAENSR